MIARGSKKPGFAPGIPRTGRPNPYLQTLVYPERFRGVRYPDAYGRKTAMNCLILEIEIPYFQVAGMVVENQGDFYFIWRPSLVHPLWIYGTQLISSIGNKSWCLTQPSARWGVQALGLGALTSPEQDDQMFLQAGVQYNLKMPLVFAKVDYVNDPYLLADVNGNEMWGYTFTAGTGTFTMQATVTLNGNGVQINDTVVITFFNSAGASVPLTITAAAVNQTTFAATSASLLGLLTTETTNALGVVNVNAASRKNFFGFRITYTGVGAPVNTTGVTLVSVQFTPVLGTTASCMDLIQYPTDWPDTAQFLQKITNYRPVSSSAWTSYEGSTLNDGGQIACIMYRGGNHPNQAGLYNFQMISTTPESYENKVRTGTYQYWLPASTLDTQMRSPINTMEWDHPYMAVAGNMGTPTQVNAIRLRGVMNMEFVSSSQLWDYLNTQYDPRLIEAAIRVLHGAPTSMENETHLKEIYNWIKRSVSDVADWGVRNSGWLIPVARGVASLL